MLQTASTVETFICIHWFHPTSLSRKCPYGALHYRIFVSVEITKKLSKCGVKNIPKLLIVKTWNIFSMWSTVTEITMMENLLCVNHAEKQNKNQIKSHLNKLHGPSVPECEPLISSSLPFQPAYFQWAREEQGHYITKIQGQAPTLEMEHVSDRDFRNCDPLIIMVHLFFLVLELVAQ